MTTIAYPASRNAWAWIIACVAVSAVAMNGPRPAKVVPRMMTAPTASCQNAAAMPNSMSISSAGTPVRNISRKFDSEAATAPSPNISSVSPAVEISCRPV